MCTLLPTTVSQFLLISRCALLYKAPLSLFLSRSLSSLPDAFPLSLMTSLSACASVLPSVSLCVCVFPRTINSVCWHAFLVTFPTWSCWFFFLFSDSFFLPLTFALFLSFFFLQVELLTVGLYSGASFSPSLSGCLRPSCSQPNTSSSDEAALWGQLKEGKWKFPHSPISSPHEDRDLALALTTNQPITQRPVQWGFLTECFKHRLQSSKLTDARFTDNKIKNFLHVHKWYFQVL